MCLQPWLQWLPQYFSLMLSALKAWSTARTALPADNSAKNPHHHHAHHHHHHPHQHQPSLGANQQAAPGLSPAAPHDQDLVDFLIMDSGGPPSSEAGRVLGGGGVASRAGSVGVDAAGGASPAAGDASHAVDPVELAGGFRMYHLSWQSLFDLLRVV